MPVEKTYHVIADFVDKETGESVAAGSLFACDDKRLAVLQAAEVVGDPATAAEIAAAKKAGDGNADDAPKG